MPPLRSLAGLVLVSSGAVAAGRAALAARGHVVETAGLAARQAAAAVGASQLMQAWDKVFYVHVDTDGSSFAENANGGTPYIDNDNFDANLEGS